MHAGNHQIQLRQHLGTVVEVAVLQNVDLDAAEDAERSEPLVQFGHHADLFGQPVGAQAVRHGEPRRVVGEHHVLVAQRHGRAGHGFDGGATVAPAAVQVQVATQGIAVDGAALGDRHTGGGLHAVEVGGLPRQRLGHHGGRTGADAVEFGEGASGSTLGHLVGRQ